MFTCFVREAKWKSKCSIFLNDGWDVWICIIFSGGANVRASYHFKAVVSCIDTYLYRLLTYLLCKWIRTLPSVRSTPLALPTNCIVRIVRFFPCLSCSVLLYFLLLNWCSMSAYAHARTSRICPLSRCYCWWPACTPCSRRTRKKKPFEVYMKTGLLEATATTAAAAVAMEHENGRICMWTIANEKRTRFYRQTLVHTTHSHSVSLCTHI